MLNSDHLKFIFNSNSNNNQIESINPKKNIDYNVLILGNFGVGKTTLYNVLNKINTRYEYKDYILNINFTNTQIQKNSINTIVSAQRYNNITTKNIDFIYLCFDINEDYIDQLHHWITFIYFKMYKIPFILIGLKQDLRNNNSVNMEHIIDYSNEKKAVTYIECSSINKFNIINLIEITRKHREKKMKSFCTFI
jgi:septin family protein